MFYLEKYDYYEVYDINENIRYGFCSEDEKMEFEEKHPNKLIFKKLTIADDFLTLNKLEQLI